jgi:hypothetical protein
MNLTMNLQYSNIICSFREVLLSELKMKYRAASSGVVYYSGSKSALMSSAVSAPEDLLFGLNASKIAKIAKLSHLWCQPSTEYICQHPV